MNTPILIPAYRPGPQLKTPVEELVRTSTPVILIIDDGSGPDYEQVFNDCSHFPKVRIVTPPVNRGKGAAIKTGIGYVLQFLPDSSGVITADADGQHHPDDILRVARALAENAGCLVLRVREFDPGVPLRSRIANISPRALPRLLLVRQIRHT